jgi:hypothetical protein
MSSNCSDPLHYPQGVKWILKLERPNAIEITCEPVQRLDSLSCCYPSSFWAAVLPA